MHALSPGLRMTSRARAYLAVVTFRNLSIGLFAVAAPQTFRSAGYHTVRELLPMVAWGALTLVVGVNAGFATLTGREGWGRAALIGSAIITGAWAGAFVAAALDSQVSAPSVPIVWTALLAKDLIVASMPLRSPLERVLEAVKSADP